VSDILADGVMDAGELMILHCVSLLVHPAATPVAAAAIYVAVLLW